MFLSPSFPQLSRTKITSFVMCDRKKGRPNVLSVCFPFRTVFEQFLFGFPSIEWGKNPPTYYDLSNKKWTVRCGYLRIDTSLCEMCHVLPTIFLRTCTSERVKFVLDFLNCFRTHVAEMFHNCLKMYSLAFILHSDHVGTFKFSLSPFEKSWPPVFSCQNVINESS